MGKKFIVILLVLSLFLFIHKDTVVAQKAQGLNPEKNAVILNDFTFRLFQKIGDTNQNIFFSPYSIAATLSLAGEGACGTTLAQIRDVIPNSFIH